MPVSQAEIADPVQHLDLDAEAVSQSNLAAQALPGAMIARRQKGCARVRARWLTTGRNRRL